MPTKETWAESVQRVWLSGDDDKLYRMLQPVIASKARMYGRKWGWARLTTEDFMSAFWEVTWKLTEKPYRGSKQTFIERLYTAIHNKAIDMIRHATRTEKGRFCCQVQLIGRDTYERYADLVNVEDLVMKRIGGRK